MRVVVVCAALCMLTDATRYTFYRALGGAGDEAQGARRVFGGRAAELSAYGAACVLLDRYWAARCSGAVLAPRWALTAAHCVSPRVAYVRYNARRPAMAEGELAAVHYLYRHPGYRAAQDDSDVTLLHHDVGLVRTRADMRLTHAPRLEPLRAMRLYDPADLRGADVQVLGFGRTEKGNLGEELFSVRLRVAPCERSAWFHCVCATAPPDNGGSPPGGALRGAVEARGVCSGDSGGPVLYNDAQIGVTSMGPLECGAEGGTPPQDATSVVTSLYQYAELVNDTIHNTEAALRMRLIGGTAPTPPPHLVPQLAALVPLLLRR